ncbi:MAG: glycosyltransferase family 9 protein [Deltaproteobacteria bacterium]|nr:glycosyltransferase family 9 protein [Deltaproteobacteria bacterium]MBW1952274.1 glycosyltransferase family 9 protein [Deltaproteobacteria bacterium]MBW1987060.1 glycosyltransferase family 9 protein [Deltaproteobacteria bacterium]MBW2133981.1 glycosyltransferase family 9 protein [Deltaproteobacteria bacterium]
MTGSPFPATMAGPPHLEKILIWHQGALGDLLLSGPALQALAAHYPKARFTLLGSPARLALLAATLPVDAIWDSQRADWAYLFLPDTPLPERLRGLLADFDLAVIFSPRPHPQITERLGQGGIKDSLWIPSFPLQDRIPVPCLQARHLALRGIKPPSGPFQLLISPKEQLVAQAHYESQGGQGPGLSPWVALAPGSGHRRKNWPLENYRGLACQLQATFKARVLWITGAAEAEFLGEIKTLAQAAGHYLLNDLPLPSLAAYLSLCQLYIGGDSGITHLATAVRRPAVLALFGPTDPVIWAPPGNQVKVITSSRDCAPCTKGREILCSDALCLRDLTIGQVLAAARTALNHG